MDPFIDADSLDPAHPSTPRKRENLARADACFARHAEVVDALPSRITLQTTDVCNLACPHCQLPPPAKRASMDPALLGHLREQLLPDLIELHPTNIGEPFAWPHFRRLCADLVEFGVVLDLTTNGTLLTQDRIEWIAPIARDVKVSFDGATRGTFERLRVGADFGATCENVSRLCERLRHVTTRRPSVSLQMTLMRDNVDELPALVGLAHALGADRVKAYHLFSFSPALDERSLLTDPRHFDTVVRPRALERGHELGVVVDLAEPGGGDPSALRPRTCPLPWHESFVDVDGAVVLCHSHEGRVAGRLDRFPEAWNGPHLRAVRRAFGAGQPAGSCAGCGMTYSRGRGNGAVPYDMGSFQSTGAAGPGIRWSGRMRPFDLTDRRAKGGE